MKISLSPKLWLIAGLALSSAFVLPMAGTAAERITGTYTFDGTAKAKGPDGKAKKKSFRGKMRVGNRSVRLQIPISKNGKVISCKRMIKIKLNKRLKSNPNRASARGKFTNASCGTSKWTGTLRLRWLEHPEGYAISFSIGAINDDVNDVQKITGKFTGSTGTLSTSENAPEVPEVPEVPVPEV